MVAAGKLAQPSGPFAHINEHPCVKKVEGGGILSKVAWSGSGMRIERGRRQLVPFLNNE